MDEQSGVTAGSVAAGLALLVDRSRALLQDARREAEASLETFVAQKISALLGLIAAGADFYRSVGVTRKSEAEGVWQRFYGRDAVAEQVEALLQLERDWDGFLDWVDKSLQTGRSTEGVPAARVGPELVLTDGRSGGSVTLAQHLQAGHKLLLVLIRHYG
ncbi:selenoprotein L isoform 2-T2 [Synchiropus picturatus]